MVELHGRHILEDVEIPGRELAEPRGHEAAVHQRPGIVGMASLQSGNEGAEPCLQEDEPEQDRRKAPLRTRHRLQAHALRRGPGIEREPDKQGQDRQRDQQMQREPVLAHVDAVDEPGFHHVPADKTLQGAQRQHADQLQRQTRPQPARSPEREEWDGEGHADKAPEQAVRPFPPVDKLEVAERHAGVHDAVLGDRLVLLERRLPVGFVERGNGAEQRLPLGDRQARTR